MCVCVCVHMCMHIMWLGSNTRKYDIHVINISYMIYNIHITYDTYDISAKLHNSNFATFTNESSFPSAIILVSN